MRRLAFACTLAVVAAAAVAAAADPLRDAVRAEPPATAEARDLAAAAFKPLSEAELLRRRGIAKTSVDYTDRDGLTGSLGFLCGLKPGAERTGAAAARGYDPSGRYVGAKLSFAFR